MYGFKYKYTIKEQVLENFDVFHNFSKMSGGDVAMEISYREMDDVLHHLFTSFWKQGSAGVYIALLFVG